MTGRYITHDDLVRALAEREIIGEKIKHIRMQLKDALEEWNKQDQDCDLIISQISGTHCKPHVPTAPAGVVGPKDGDKHIKHTKSNKFKLQRIAQGMKNGEFDNIMSYSQLAINLTIGKETARRLISIRTNDRDKLDLIINGSGVKEVYDAVMNAIDPNRPDGRRKGKVMPAMMMWESPDHSL